MTRERRLSLLKTLPGFLISAFFLWFTFRGFKLADFKGIRLEAPVWIVGVVLFSVAGYTVRCYRWWRMLRSVGARFSACARVFMTSLAANNILPLRIGDVMRIFTYSGDLNATPSIILSTVILEKLLDIFTIAILFVITIHFSKDVSHHLLVGAEAGIAVSTVGLLVLVFGARVLEQPVKRLFARTKNEKLAKLEHWLLLALDCIRQIGVLGTLGLVGYSFVAWFFEGLLYISAAHLVGLQTDWAGPWQAVAQANLSFLIPSSPGGIGPFEWACKDALIRHGATAASGGIFGLLIHAWLWVSITAVGGGMFLIHRFQSGRRKPLLAEIETLPTALP
ncbi:MAG TPA: lysylphosphatidylglycerol synthase transmembrane domain-containing protein [Granulicella sp.]